MSTEIRAGENRTYWILNNGSNYMDGVTDPGLVTTVGDGLYLYWIGTNYNEYLSSCSGVAIIPRINDPNTASYIVTANNRLSARQARLWLINKGIDLNNIDSAIDTIEDENIRKSVKVEWEYAPYIEYGHPWLVPLAAILGLSEQDLKDAFIEGANI